MATESGDQSEIDETTYAELYKLDDTFDTLDAVVTAFQAALTRPAHEKLASFTKRIPNFWPLVFERAPPDVDQFIQPSDSQVFASCLTGFSVDRFESKGSPDAFALLLKTSRDDIEEQALGEPRSLRLRFEFKENEWFEDQVIEKRFWFRRSIKGEGDDRETEGDHVSEPVKINWKQGKDLSEGLTDAACAFWESAKSKGLLEATDHNDSKHKDEEIKKLDEYQSLLKKVENSTEGSQSFFTWFSFHGQWVTPAQDKAARALEKEQRAGPPKNPKDNQAGSGANEGDGDDDDDEMDDVEELPAQMAVEIFPDAAELAIILADEVFSPALKLFMEAQEGDDEDMLSEGSFDEADLEEIDEEDLKRANMDEIKGLAGRIKHEEKDTPPSKKRRT